MRIPQLFRPLRFGFDLGTHTSGVTTNKSFTSTGIAATTKIVNVGADYYGPDVSGGNDINQTGFQFWLVAGLIRISNAGGGGGTVTLNVIHTFSASEITVPIPGCNAITPTINGQFSGVTMIRQDVSQRLAYSLVTNGVGGTLAGTMSIFFIRMF